MAILPIYESRAILLLFYYRQKHVSESKEIDILELDHYLTRRYQCLYGKIICISHMTGKNIVAIIPIYKDRSIFILFCDHQDTGYE